MQILEFSGIYWLLASAMVLMVTLLVLTWRSTFPQSTKVTLTIVSVMSPWIAVVLYAVFAYQQRKRRNAAS